MDSKQQTEPEPIELTTLTQWVQLTGSDGGEVLVNVDLFHTIRRVRAAEQCLHPMANTVLTLYDGDETAPAKIFVREPFGVVAALVRGEAGNG